MFFLVINNKWCHLVTCLLEHTHFSSSLFTSFRRQRCHLIKYRPYCGKSRSVIMSIRQTPWLYSEGTRDLFTVVITWKGPPSRIQSWNLESRGTDPGISWSFRLRVFHRWHWNVSVMDISSAEAHHWPFENDLYSWTALHPAFKSVRSPSVGFNDLFAQKGLSLTIMCTLWSYNPGAFKHILAELESVGFYGNGLQD